MMKEISKDKITGIVGTLVFHALVVLLLYFLVMSKPPQEPEAGLAVVMGEEYNMTEVEIAKPEPAPAPNPAPKPVEQKPAPEKPMITQKSEESMAVDSLQAKEREEALMAERLEAERKRKEEEAMAKATNLMANAFGKGSGMSRKSEESVDEGSSKGSPTAEWSWVLQLRLVWEPMISKAVLWPVTAVSLSLYITYRRRDVSLSR